MANANLWIINYCILEMKAGNEPAISLPVYFKSFKTRKYVLRKLTPQKTKGPNKKVQNVSNGESQTPDLRRGSLICYLLRHNN